MINEENFNEIIQGKFSEWEHPADEQNWSAMRSTIKHSRIRGLRIKWASGSLGAVVAVSGIYGVYKLNSGGNEPKTVVSKPIPSVNTTVNPATTAVLKQQNSLNSNEATITQASGSTILNGVNTNQAVTGNKASLSPKIAYHYSKRNPLGPDNSSTQEPVSSSLFFFLLSHHLDNTAATDDNSLPSTGNSLPTIGNTLPVTGNTVPSAGSNAVSTAGNQGLSTESQVERLKAAKTVNSLLPVNVTMNNEIPTIPLENKPGYLKKAGDLVFTKADNMGIQDNHSSDKKWFFSIEGGAGYGFGWKYGNVSQGNGVTPEFGVGVTRKITPKCAFKTGLHVSTLTGMGNPPYVISHVNYDFGYSAVDTEVTTNWLIYATIPFQFEYTFNPKWAVGAGGSISYLVASTGNVTAYDISYNNPTTVSSHNASNFYVEGYNPWNASVNFSVKRYLCRKCSIYLSPYYGLMDIKNNSFFGVNKFERDYGIKALFSYTLF